MQPPNLLGKGSFGQVFHLIDSTTGADRAVKRIILALVKNRQDVVEEGKILEKVLHPNIVRYFISYCDEADISKSNYYFIIMEYINGQSIREIIHAAYKDPTYKSTIKEEIMFRWLQQTSDALSYMHSFSPNPLYHRDIKPANIMISRGQTEQDSVVKLVDLGLGEEISDQHTAKHFAGTEKYASYEKLHHLGYDGKDDIWSVGCVFMELMLSQCERLKEEFKYIRNIEAWCDLKESEIANLGTKISLQKKYSNVLFVVKELLVIQPAALRPSAQLLCKLTDVSLRDLIAELNSEVTSFVYEISEKNGKFAPGTREWLMKVR